MRRWLQSGDDLLDQRMAERITPSLVIERDRADRLCYL